MLLAIREAVGPGVVLRADANRAWSLEHAITFGRHVSAAKLQYVEEPTINPADMLHFFMETGVAVAVDESLDEGIIGPTACQAAAASISSSSSSSKHSSSSRHSSSLPRSPLLPLTAHTGLAAVVIKPSVVGGLEASWAIATWARKQGAQPTISSSFESSVGISVLCHLAAAVHSTSMDKTASQPAAEHQHHYQYQYQQQQQQQHGLHGSTSSDQAQCRDHTNSPHASFHGLGTLHWFKQDVLTPRLMGSRHVSASSMESKTVMGFDLEAAQDVLKSVNAVLAQGCISPVVVQDTLDLQTTWGQYQVGYTLVQPAVLGDVVPPGNDCSSTTSTEGDMQTGHVHFGSGIDCVSSRLSHPAPTATRCPVVFLHGFLGDSSDWLPHMKALAAEGYSCLAVDLPGHGHTRACNSRESSDSNMSGSESGSRGNSTTSGDLVGSQSMVRSTDAYSFEATASLVVDTVQHIFQGTGCSKAVVVGYSMGARVALHLALQQPELWCKAVVVSGTPGISNADDAMARVSHDHQLAQLLGSWGVGKFVDWWYRQPLWQSLTRHARFGLLKAKRAHTGDADQLAAALIGMSTGSMVSGHE